jgi:hypothetical protein
MADATLWSRHVAGWRASRQAAAEYCAQHGIDLKALRYWTRKLDDERRATALVPPVRIARVERVAALPPPTAPSMIIELHGARVVVGGGIDRDTLTTVLEVLAARASR